MGGTMNEFENILETIQSKGAPKQQTTGKKQNGNCTLKSNTIPKSDILFDVLKKQNTDLDLAIKNISDDISNIRTNNTDSLSKNLTFSMVFSALEVAVKEYEYQSGLFEEYSKMYDEMCNEENIVRVLDLLRLIITDRRMILNDITNNILKIQRLDNDRIKMDSSMGDDSEIGDLITPDSL